MSLVCENLATKAELEELKQQINTLLGKKEDGGSIDVLEQGDFEGTIIKDRFDLAESAIQDFGIGTESNGILSEVDELAISNVAAGSLSYVAYKGKKVIKLLPKATAAGKRTTLKLVQNASVGKVATTGAQVSASGLSLLASLSNIIASLGLNIATTKVLGFRIDQVEKSQLSFNNDYQNIFKILGIQKGNLEKANQEIQKGNQVIAKQEADIQDILGQLETSEENVAYLAIYWDNYVNYLGSVDDQQPNVGNGTSKPPQTELYVQPFALDLDVDQYLKVSGTQDRWTTFGSSFANYTKETLNTGGGEISLKLRNVRPARMVIKTGISTSKTVVTAKATKRKYVSYGGTSGSIPFGKNSTETEVEAFQTLKTAVQAGSFNPQTMRISRVKEVA